MSIEIEIFDGKQPGEGKYYGLNFINEFRPDDITTTATDTLASNVVTIADSAGVDKTSTMIDATKQVLSGCWAFIFIQAGVTSMTYKGKSVGVSTPGGQTAEIDFYITVTEV